MVLPGELLHFQLGIFLLNRAISLSLGDLALLHTGIDLRSNTSRQGSSNSVNIGSRNGVAQLRGDDIVGQGKRLIGHEAKAAILVGEDGQCGDFVAIRVDLGVQSSLVKDGHHVGADLVADDTLLAIGINSAELRDGLGDKAAGLDDEHLCGAGVYMKLADGATCLWH